MFALTTSGRGRKSCGLLVVKLLPAEVDSLLGHLSGAVLGVNVWLVLHHLHPLPAAALLAAVLTNHVELPDPVLEGGDRFAVARGGGGIGKEREKKQS